MADLQGLRDTPLVPYGGHGGGYIYIYIQLPAANPPPCLGRWIDPSIYSCSDWLHLRIFGKSFWHPWGSLWSPFWSHFGGLGHVLTTLGCPGAPKGSREEQKAGKVVSRDPLQLSKSWFRVHEITVFICVYFLLFFPGPPK